MQTKIYKVDSVELRLVKTNPKQLYVVAKGSAPTSGWTNPVLVLISKTRSAGVYEFDFCATPPEGVALQVITPISASYHFPEIPTDLKIVKVNAASNSIKQDVIVEEKLEFPSGTTKAQLETLYGIEALKGVLSLRVPSTGCTSKQSFRIDLDKGTTGKPPFKLSVYRIIPDYCEMYLPDGIILEWAFSELGLNPNDTLILENVIGKP